MGLFNSDVEHRSFLMQIAKKLHADEIDEMKFLIEGGTVNRMRLELANVRDFIRILGELQCWSFHPTVRLKGFAELCRKILRHDLAECVEKYGKKTNFDPIFWQNMHNKNLCGFSNRTYSAVNSKL